MVHPYTRLFTLPAPPDADNDITEGYELGDVVHVTGGSVYDCRDTTEGAAVWEERTSGGSGDVDGPASAVDDRIATFDGTTGKIIKDGGATVASLATAAQIVTATQEDNIDGADLFGYRQTSGAVLKKTSWGNILNIIIDEFYSLFHNHDGVDTVKLVQANTHESPDTDSAASSLHHTLGGSATQALPGNVWIPGTGTWSYTSADSPVFVASVPDADAALMDVGWRIKLTQTTAKYFIVTAKGSPSGGFTPVTIYGGTDYTLANAAISSPYFSPVKAPLGFPLNPDKWTVKVTDSSDRTQATPTATTWYNLGSITISIPIGCWKVSYKVVQRVADASVALINQYSTLSTANNSESDAELTHLSALGGSAGALVLTNTAFEEKVITVAAKTSYYLNAKTTLSSIDSIAHRGDAGTSIIQAVCAYL